MPQYNKADLGRAAAQYGYVRDTFEKVLRLKEVRVRLIVILIRQQSICLTLQRFGVICFL